ncbi:MAG TPA: hypothetical protein PKD64_01705 [Pirellulaceae bacterium]|nr:hypothetical protein [Pirellulaceae bacterium]HMO90885.1 hypothetical protein [Pirellulaceae bacterium]HMP68639.1 hypothetical protein [Pirellulaceae bacterium]
MRTLELLEPGFTRGIIGTFKFGAFVDVDCADGPVAEVESPGTRFGEFVESPATLVAVAGFQGQSIG